MIVFCLKTVRRSSNYVRWCQLACYSGHSYKVNSYSALFAVRCGALSYSSWNVNVTQRTVNDAAYERTFNLVAQVIHVLLSTESIHMPVAALISLRKGEHIFNG